MVPEVHCGGSPIKDDIILFSHESVLALRIDNWRAERLASVAIFEVPGGILHGPRVVLHIIPLSLFGLRSHPFDLSSVSQERPGDGGCRIAPLLSTDFDSEHNFDGFLTYTATAYVQVFRFGGIESARLLSADGQGAFQLQVDIEVEVLRSAKRYIEFLCDYGIKAPLVVMLSVTDTANVIAVCRSYKGLAREKRIDRKELLTPRALITDPAASLAQAMRPMFDSLYGAVGLPGSPHYGEGGEWIGQKI